jgi:transposase-like protein
MNDVCAAAEVNVCTSETVRISPERNEPNYECDDCKMTFITLALLSDHKKIHARVQSSFKCQDCDKTFRSSYPLTLHQRVHSGERPHECEVTKYKFSIYLQLQAHVLAQATDNFSTIVNSMLM